MTSILVPGLFIAASMVSIVIAPSAAANDAFGTLELSGSNWFGGQGVDVYSNGSYGYVGNTYDYVTINGQSVKVGLEWQCVELAQRFYTVQGWHSGLFPGVNGAADIWTAAANMSMTTQPNGQIGSVVPGDMIIHGTSDSFSPNYGHVAIVDYISTAADGTKTVHAVQQNAPATTTYTLTTTSTGFSLSGGSGSDIKGIIHSPNNKNTGTTGGGGGTTTAHHVDLAWFANTNHLYTFTGSALGTTGDATPYYTPTWAGVGDYNHDGKDDLFLYDGPTSTIYWASSDGTGIGTHGMAAIRGPGIGAPDWAAVGDFTGDGHKDSLVWFQGNTLYTFSGSCLCTTGTVTGFHAPTWGGVGDYNHDGKDDLILYDGPSSTIYWMSSNGSAVGANGLGAIRGPGVGAPTWAAVGNFSGDGYRDSLAWFQGNTLYTFTGSGLGTTGAISGYTAPTWGGVGDYNHDGKDDLILYDGPTTTIYWMSSNGSAIGSGGLGAIRGPGVGAPTWAGAGNFEGG